MRSILGTRHTIQNSSPLEGSDSFRSQQSDSGLRQVARREWWLWFSALFVAILSSTAFVLSSFPSLFRHHEHFYEIRSDQARWGILCLLLLFNGWMLYRQWSFRRERKQFDGQNVLADAAPSLITSSSGLDTVTGLHTRGFIEQQLGKEIGRARRQNTALSLATVHLDEFAERLASDDFILVLPECNLGEVKTVLNRLGAIEVVCSGRRINLAYTTGFVDYQPGDLPADMLKRASQLLHLYENAAKDSFSATLAPH